MRRIIFLSTLLVSLTPASGLAWVLAPNQYFVIGTPERYCNFVGGVCAWDSDTSTPRAWDNLDEGCSVQATETRVARRLYHTTNGEYLGHWSKKGPSVHQSSSCVSVWNIAAKRYSTSDWTYLYGYPIYGTPIVGTCRYGMFFNPHTHTCQPRCEDPDETFLPPPDDNPTERVCGKPNPPCESCCPGDGDGPGVGNPCNPGSGNKHQTESDFVAGNTGLNISRSYNSLQEADRGIGIGWTLNILRMMDVGPVYVVYRESSGREQGFIKNRDTGVWSGRPDNRMSFSRDDNVGYTITKRDGSSEEYDLQGRLLTETDANGRTTTYSYNTQNQLETVTNHFGQELSLTWGAGNHVGTITNAYGGVYTYEYDANNNLIRVTYPDTTTRQYHYEDPNFPNYLTGITDENGDRYATFAYDSEGRAVSTSHADIGNGPQEQFQIDYTQDD